MSLLLLGAQRMRTLVDLLNDDSGYVRIYAEQVGFGYERSTYSARVIGDLFDRMGGYTSAASALEAAQLQLRAREITGKITRKRTKRRRKS